VGLNFDRLVGKHAQRAFARPAQVTPVVSQPGEPPYDARGIFRSDKVDIPLEGGGVASDQRTTLDVRMAEFDVQIMQGDKVQVGQMGARTVVPSDKLYRVADVDEDGQGGLRLDLMVWTDE
jgi:hypothetical protein